MKLRDIDFGCVWGASGVQGFFGEGYPYHHLTKSLGFGPVFDGMTFVAKTTTLDPKEGNMPLQPDGITPKKLKPKCIRVKPWVGAVLNSVGLSGPGVECLLNTGKWQSRTEPFVLSFMSVAKVPADRYTELAGFVTILKEQLPQFNAPVALQINLSCPNVCLDTKKLLEEAQVLLSIAKQLKIPLMFKLSVTTPVEAITDISKHPDLDALCISNTIPYGCFPEKINWEKLFGKKSPLEHLGGGGLSGAPIFPLVINWLEEAKDSGIEIPINVGGGIMSPADVDKAYGACADSIFIGSMAMLRPWRVRPTISRALELFSTAKP